MVELDKAECAQIVARCSEAFRRELAKIMRRKVCQHDFRYDAKFGGTICSKCSTLKQSGSSQ